MPITPGLPGFPTPSDSPIHPGRTSIPQRGIRKRVFTDGDHALLAISDGTNAPKGALLWIPGIPKFEKRSELDLWLKRNDNKQRLVGHQVAHVKFVDLYQPMELPRTSVALNVKRKFAVNVPTTEHE